MGKEILYCHRCGKQLAGDDFTRGRAHTFDNRQYCTACLPSHHTPKPMAAQTSSSSRLSKRQPSSMHLPSPASTSSSSSHLALLGGGLVVIAAIVLLIVMGSRPAAPPSGPPPADPPRTTESRKLAEEEARKAVERAREFSSGNPHLVDERVRLWELAVALSSKSSYAEEAHKGLERAITQRKEEFAQELRAVEQKIAERLKLEQFGGAADVLEEAKKRHETQEWTTTIAKRIRDVQDQADRLYAEDLKPRAVAAQTTGDSSRIAELKGRLSSWGRRDLVSDLDAELSKVLPREAIPEKATLLFRFPGESPRKFKLFGTLRDNALVAADYNGHAAMSGFEWITEEVTIPTEGEMWVTYSTNSTKPFQLRFRINRGDKNYPFNFYVDKPETGRPIRVKAPMTRFRDYNDKYVNVGDTFNTIYIQQDDPKAELIVYEVVLIRTKE